MCAAVPGSANASSWALQAAPSVPTAKLFAISCDARRTCIVAGSAKGTAGVRGFAARWNAGGWSFLRSRTPLGARSSTFFGLSCRLKTVCIAVGQSTNGSGMQTPLAERLSGSRWSAARVPLMPHARNSSLNGVSCVSPKFCIAVGSFTDPSGNERALIERWSGNSWSLQRVQGPASLSDVSCRSASACIAVGYAPGGNDVVPWVARWNGDRWSSGPTPDPGGLDDELNAVSCTSARSCFAVGTAVIDSFFDVRSFGESWDGQRWSFHDAANAGASSGLLDVSCLSPGACIAVGTFENSLGLDRPLVEEWNGSWWSVEPTARPADATTGSFSGVSCIAARGCMAVGNFAIPPRSSRPLVERRSG